MEIVNRNASKIILGSYPGEVSGGVGRYYSHPSNKIWSLLSIDSSLTYEEKIRELDRRDIGLWDVESSCNRVNKDGKKSSLDRYIKDEKYNKLNILLDKEIYFNGKKAMKDFKKAAREQNIKFDNSRLHLLLSSSNANNKYNMDREKQWKEFFK